MSSMSPSLYGILSTLLAVPYMALLLIAGGLCVGRWRRRGTPRVALAVGILIVSPVISFLHPVIVSLSGTSSYNWLFASLAINGFRSLAQIIALGLLFSVVLELQNRDAAVSRDEDDGPSVLPARPGNGRGSILDGAERGD